MNNMSNLSKQQAAKKPRLNIVTLINAIANDPVWNDAIRLNLFSEKVLVSAEFPPDGNITRYRELDDVFDTLEATVYFQSNGFPGARRGTVKDALLATAKRNAFHPVMDYLNSLKWDGKERIHLLAQEYFKASIICSDDDEEQVNEKDRTKYLHATSKCWMIAAVARIMRPGCKVDNLPVLVGPEAYSKSEGLRELCPHPDWFSEDLSTELGERDTKESLCGKWIIELSEIPHARREADRVKAFFSRRTDRYRKAYGSASADHDRQNVFVGTSNDLEFTSNTGNRRFWPWDVTSPVDIDAIRTNRDNLWAEAVHRFRKGEQWWLDRDTEVIAADIQGAFTDGDEAWFDPINLWTSGKTEPFMLTHLFVDALGYEAPPIIDKRDQMRAGGVLKTLGFHRRRERHKGIRGYWWRPVKAKTVSPP